MMKQLGSGVTRMRQRDGRTGRLLGLRGTKTAAGDVGAYAYFADRPNTLQTAGGATYAWDANGNNTSGGGRALTYTVFDKVATVTKGGHATAFEYGPDRARYMRADTETGQTTTTLYIGGLEKVAHPDGRREVRRYIDGLVIETKKYGAAGALTDTNEQYVLKDHLGSVDVITDADGAVAQEMSFDPWGQRRNAADWSSLSGSALTDFDASRTPRGFTGHEHLDEAGIIHMNGRIHDPKLGRFLQADPYVQNPRLPGGHNRYAYAMNNPLNAVDPSGFNCWNHDNYGESDCSRPDRFPEPPDYIDRDRPDNDLRDLYNFLVWVSYHLGQFSETGSWNIALGATNPGIASSNISSILPGAVSSLQQGASLPTGTTEEQLTDIAAGQTCSDETGCKFANGAAFIAFASVVHTEQIKSGSASIETLSKLPKDPKSVYEKGVELARKHGILAEGQRVKFESQHALCPRAGGCTSETIRYRSSTKEAAEFIMDNPGYGLILGSYATPNPTGEIVIYPAATVSYSIRYPYGTEQHRKYSTGRKGANEGYTVTGAESVVAIIAHETGHRSGLPHGDSMDRREHESIERLRRP